MECKINRNKLLIFSIIFILLLNLICYFYSFSSKNHILTGSTLNNARQMENLDRGLIAMKVDNGVYLSWRMLGTDSDDISFNIYRNDEKINSSPITTSTNFLDEGGDLNSNYYIRPVLNAEELEASSTVTVLENPYLSLPLNKPEDGVTPDGEEYSYSANDASVGDVDSDGQYEIILKWTPSNAKDNSQAGYTGNTYLDAYKLDGTFLWRIDLGVNIRSGAHYTQFMVYDFDGDGKAEIACKTADGTKDGAGNFIGDETKDFRNEKGYILDGPEYLTMFEGSTGKALSTIDFSPERGNVSDWGDKYGNRVDRFLAGVAYLDGIHPSLIMSRGYYVKTCITAYDFKDNQLVPRWNFVADDKTNSNYRDRGCHSLSVADVDNDGKDEIIFGAATIDDDGTGLYTTNFSHGDALHVGDLDPARDGLEVFQVHEAKSGPANATLRDAKTGEVLWSIKASDRDCGRGLTGDIDPRYPGEEMWAPCGVGLYSIKGEKISSKTPSMNFAAWWDGDLSRELVDKNRIDKWDYTNNEMYNLLTADGCSSNNSTKATPVLQADILGDWREEVIWRTDDSNFLRIYSTTDVTDHRIYTLMHDPVYRLGVAWQNVGYNQPPHTGFFLGTDMKKAPIPNIYLAPKKD
jgi:rhamnogalacturonan endolyase